MAFASNRPCIRKLGIDNSTDCDSICVEPLEVGICSCSPVRTHTKSLRDDNDTPLVKSPPRPASAHGRGSRPVSSLVPDDRPYPQVRHAQPTPSHEVQSATTLLTVQRVTVSSPHAPILRVSIALLTTDPHCKPHMW